MMQKNVNSDLFYNGPITRETLSSRTREPIKDRFRGKAAIVTGGTAGIGKSIALELLKEGANVTITGRRKNVGEAVIQEFKDKGHPECIYLSGDMSDEDFCRSIVKETVKAFGKLDYLVNNAFNMLGVGREATTQDLYECYFGGPVNYLRMIQFSAEEMVKTGGGAIVNISSISGHIAQPRFLTYNMMKGAVGMLTKSAAMEYARDHIRINQVSPAHTWTERMLSRFDHELSPEEYDDIKYTGQGYMLNRGGECVEVAAPTLFLLSDDASYITGTEFMADGGFITLGGEGCIEKAYRDERVYGKPISYGTGGWSVIFNPDKPVSDYPELFGNMTKEDK